MKEMSHNTWVLFFLLICSCSNNATSPSNINTKASFPESFEFSPAGLKVINTFIDNDLGTMSTLYGNPLAVQKTISLNNAFAGGELFTLVTWKQQPDAHWFGANIPGELQSVELVKTKSINGTIAFDYARYEKKMLVLNSDTTQKSQRIRFILEQKPSVMP